MFAEWNVLQAGGMQLWRWRAVVMKFEKERLLILRGSTWKKVKGWRILKSLPHDNVLWELNLRKRNPPLKSLAHHQDWSPAPRAQPPSRSVVPWLRPPVTLFQKFQNKTMQEVFNVTVRTILQHVNKTLFPSYWNYFRENLTRHHKVIQIVIYRYSCRVLTWMALMSVQRPYMTYTCSRCTKQELSSTCSFKVSSIPSIVSSSVARIKLSIYSR